MLYRYESFNDYKFLLQIKVVVFDNSIWQEVSRIRLESTRT